MSPKAHQAKLIILSAPSGAGKTTLCNKILQAFPSQILLSVSSTTRAPRTKGSSSDLEVHGKDYFFLNKDEFEKKINSHEFAEWAKVHEELYGTEKKFLETKLQQGVSVLLDIDVQGAKQLTSIYPLQVLSIFIHPPSMEELEKRLRGRGSDSEEKIKKRLQNAKNEILEAKNFQHQIVNDDLEKTFLELKKIIQSETHHHAI